MNKETQGHRKLKQYLEDLRRNKHFMAKVNKVKKILANNRLARQEEIKEGKITDLISDIEEFHQVYQKIEKEKPSQINQISADVAEDYGIEGELFSDTYIHGIFGKDELELGGIYDMCSIVDNYDIHFNPVYPYVPFVFDTNRQHHYMAYPVSIDLHKFSTKRDLLDFIEKRWEIIESYLQTYRGDKKVRFRQRKYDRKLTDFIWNNRKLGIKQLKTKLDKEFPNNKLVYYEIGKLISIEKQRRFKKITVGQ